MDGAAKRIAQYWQIVLALWSCGIGIGIVVAEPNMPTPAPTTTPYSTNFGPRYPAMRPVRVCYACCGRDVSICNNSCTADFRRDMNEIAEDYNNCMADENEPPENCRAIRSALQESARDQLKRCQDGPNGCADYADLCRASCDHDAAWCTLVDNTPVFGLPAPSPTASPTPVNARNRTDTR